MAKFKRPVRERKIGGDDSPGLVIIRISRVGVRSHGRRSGTVVPGSYSGLIRVDQAKVSEVLDTIELALFGED